MAAHRKGVNDLVHLKIHDRTTGRIFTSKIAYSKSHANRISKKEHGTYEYQVV